eukprot:CAMPEP_0168320504 /NCGR_PEP_ID=MMETSP0213-20121227/1710_1 /TAXON_ID=151035 /ORGANISM="Euplotes harpa, Strain FSP1.4" /LENGTH=88 /DNA_ID=CAMNT_0008321967 /DNA_START=9 /DNA_END=275 /DNA_ORIENTATION=+
MEEENEGFHLGIIDTYPLLSKKKTTQSQKSFSRGRLQQKVGDLIMKGDVLQARYHMLKNSNLPFLADEPYRANPLEFKHLKPVVSIPY